MEVRQYKLGLFRLICFLMALVAINLSTDSRVLPSQSGQSATYQNDFSANQIERFGEFILGNWLDFSNAIPEQDTPGKDSEILEPEADYDFIRLFIFDVLLSSVQFLTTGNILFRPEPFLVYVPEINAPPPQPIA